ncbi:hypothetical protein Syun_030782 [Stephania yunnanensis]|uniref:Uncharacterized protein n=1 Tax=Stephania yunnanensis TaxID=152371 RepID=A0AAP0E2E8_9MAGN
MPPDRLHHIIHPHRLPVIHIHIAHGTPSPPVLALPATTWFHSLPRHTTCTPSPPADVYPHDHGTGRLRHITPHHHLRLIPLILTGVGDEHTSHLVDPGTTSSFIREAELTRRLEEMSTQTPDTSIDEDAAYLEVVPEVKGRDWLARMEALLMQHLGIRPHVPPTPRTPPSPGTERSGPQSDDHPGNLMTEIAHSQSVHPHDH